MSSNIFEGVSETGDISAAFNDAIAKARRSLPLAQYVWRLDSVSGNMDGAVLIKVVAVEALSDPFLLA